MGDATDTKRRGWQQGSVLTAEAAAVASNEIALQQMPADGMHNAWLVVVLRDCDRLHSSSERFNVIAGNGRWAIGWDRHDKSKTPRSA